MMIRATTPPPMYMSSFLLSSSAPAQRPVACFGYERRLPRGHRIGVRGHTRRCAQLDSSPTRYWSHRLSGEVERTPPARPRPWVCGRSSPSTSSPAVASRRRSLRLALRGTLRPVSAALVARAVGDAQARPVERELSGGLRRDASARNVDLRIAMSVNQARSGYLAGTSRTIVFHRA